MNGEKFLDDRPARELTSREVAKLLGGFLGGAAGCARPERLKAALDFYASDQNKDAHRQLWEEIWKEAVIKKTVVPEPWTRG